jgi:hypothetical protein
MDEPSGFRPVYRPWQAAVDAACLDLCQRLAVPATDVAPTRVVDGVEEEAGPSVPGSSLSVWLMSGGETFRYLVSLDAPLVVTFVAGPPWYRERS